MVGCLLLFARKGVDVTTTATTVVLSTVAVEGNEERRPVSEGRHGGLGRPEGNPCMPVVKANVAARGGRGAAEDGRSAGGEVREPPFRFREKRKKAITRERARCHESDDNTQPSPLLLFCSRSSLCSLSLSTERPMD